MKNKFVSGANSGVDRNILRVLAILLLAGGGLVFTFQTSAQRIARSVNTKVTTKQKTPAGAKKNASAAISARVQNVDSPGEMVGVPWEGEPGISERTDRIMGRQISGAPKSMPERIMVEKEYPDRSQLAQDPNSSIAPETESKSQEVIESRPEVEPRAPQTTGTNFTAATLADTGAFPPDTMGAVGPTQFFAFLNGRLRTFNKTTGAADGVINADSDVFFASVMTPLTGGVTLNFTSDPQVRYDRLTSRWFLQIIDVPSTSAGSIGDRPNRVLIAVSDAASAGVLSVSTVWTFYFVQQDTVGGPSTGEFLDYDSLGVDNNALYIGGNMFGAVSGSFVGCSGFVVRKSSVLSGGPIVTTAFRNIVLGAGEGPFAPRGVDNYDPAATEGYFVGVSNAAFGRLVFRRISTPGGVPTISANILLTVTATSFPRTVDHLGDTGGTNGNLDALDDRLYAAHIRNGRLWTSHNIAVTAAGVASNSNAQRRDAVRWYELNGVRSTDNGGAGVGVPVVVQSGLIFDNAATVALARQYWIPTVMVSGQGHAALGFSTAGTPFRADAATNGRLVGDTLGSTQAVALYTASATAYNPPSDPGGASGRRWGDYSFVSLDPKDNMTMWTIQEFCNATNSYGVRAVKLIAPPPPPTNTANPAAINLNNPSRNIVVTGTAPAGQGYYDPGADPAAPHTPFTHISASGAGIIVNSITFNTPTQVTMNVSTVGSTPGSKTVTITNPDGQTTTVQILVGPTAAPATISGRVTTEDGAALAGVTLDLGGGQSAKAITDASGAYSFGSADTNSFYTVTPSMPGYHFSPEDRSFSLLANKTDAVFTATRDATIRQNVIDSPDYFVRQQYLDFLGREPDQSGFNFWTNQIAQCNGDADCMTDKRVNVSAAFFMSIEFQETGGLVDRLYRTSFDRPPQYAEFTPDAATVAREVVVGKAGWEQQLASNRQAFLNAFVQREAFQSVYGGLNNSQYVDQLLTNTRIVWAQEQRDALVNNLASGTLTRANVLGQIAGDERFTATKRNEMFVMMEYFGYLHRDPDASGYQFWLNKLNQFGGNYQKAEMVKAFIVSGEYRRRFGL